MLCLEPVQASDHRMSSHIAYPASFTHIMKSNRVVKNIDEWRRPKIFLRKSIGSPTKSYYSLLVSVRS